MSYTVVCCWRSRILQRFSVGPSMNPAVTVPSCDSSDAFSPHQQLLFIDGDELVERPAQVMDSVQKFLKIPQVNYLKLLRLVQVVFNVTFVSVAARCVTEAISTTCAVQSYRGLWGLVVVRLLWLSGRGFDSRRLLPFSLSSIFDSNILLSCLFVVGNKFVNGYVHIVYVWISVGYINLPSFKVTLRLWMISTIHNHVIIQVMWQNEVISPLKW